MKIYLKEKNGLLKLFEGDLTAELKQRQIIIGEWAIIGEGVIIGEGANIGALARIGEEARIGEGVIIGEWARIGALANIGEEAIIGEGARIGERANIGERASIGEEASIGALANIGKGASITMTYECIVLGPLGSRSAMMTAYVLNEIIQIGAGCFLDSIEKFESQVKEVHAGTRHEKEYLAALDYVRAKFAIKP